MDEERLNWYLREFTNPAARMALDEEERKGLYDEIKKACDKYNVEYPYWVR